MLTKKRKEALLDTFIQPKLDKILQEVGVKYGLTKIEAINLFLIYYKEFFLKNLSEFYITTLSIVNLCTIKISQKKLIRFRYSKQNDSRFAKKVNIIMDYNVPDENTMILLSKIDNEIFQRYKRKHPEKYAKRKVTEYKIFS